MQLAQLCMFWCAIFPFYFKAVYILGAQLICRFLPKMAKQGVTKTLFSQNLLVDFDENMTEDVKLMPDKVLKVDTCRLFWAIEKILQRLEPLPWQNIETQNIEWKISNTRCRKTKYRSRKKSKSPNINGAKYQTCRILKCKISNRKISKAKYRRDKISKWRNAEIQII